MILSNSEGALCNRINLCGLSNPAASASSSAAAKSSKKRSDYQARVDAALKSLKEAAAGSDNLLYPMREALSAYATLGEVSDTLRGVFGEYEPGAR